MLPIHAVALLVSMFACPPECGSTQTPASGTEAKPIILSYDGAKFTPLTLTQRYQQGAMAGRPLALAMANSPDGRSEEGDDAEAVEIKNIEAGGPWLGIQFGPVPKPLASHLNLDGENGLMILNVGQDSPADDSGMLQYDVIVQVDGQDVPSDVSKFLDVVRAFNPGEKHTFALVRGAKPTNAVVTVGTRPENPDALKYKYEMPEELKDEQMFHRGGMLQKDPQGNWVFQGIDPRNLPDVWKALPQGNNFQMFTQPGKGTSQKFYVYNSSDGKNIRIEQNDGGDITVTTIDNQGNNSTTTAKTYKNEEELKAGDPDAYKMFKEGVSSKVETFGNFPGGKMYMQQLPGGTFSFQVPEFDKDVQKRLEEATKQYEEAMKQLEPGQAGAAWWNKSAMKRKPSTSFETLENGKIRVTVRQGDSELVDVYENVEALKDARPDLYKKYDSLQDKPAAREPTKQKRSNR